MTTKLYVGNLSDSATEKNIQELFETFGQVDEVAVLRGFGFVVSQTIQSRKGDRHVRPALIIP